MSALHKLKVKKVIKETADCVSVSIDVPQDLREAFEYVSGQYLALETDIKGEKVRRSYSLCSAPHENEWKVAIKKVEGGKFSTYANESLSDNDDIYILPPSGGFVLEPNSASENHYVAYGAGSGITPILSMIKTVMHEEPKSKFTLFYGNRNFETIIFREEIEALKNIYLDRLSVHHILSKEKLGSPLFFGRIDAQKCEKFGKVFYNPTDVTGYFLCGPSQMIFGVKDQLISQGVDNENIHFELFNTSDIPIKDKKEEEKQFDSEAQSKVTIVLDGESFDMALDYGGNNILDAALSAGADLPYACKGGVCSTCKAQVTSGEATMDINYALEPDEVEKGFILTCQAHPRTAEITVNFDEA